MLIFRNFLQIRRIFGPKRDEITREWRNIYSEELLICNVHPVKIENNEMDRPCSMCGERRDVYWILVGKPEGETTWKTHA